MSRELAAQGKMNFNTPQPTRRHAHPPEPAALLATDPKDDEIDIVSLFAALWRGKWWFFSYIAVAVCAAVYYIFAVATPYYQSTGWLALQVNDAPVVDIQSVVSGLSTELEAINTEIEIITSRELLLQLVDEMDLVDDPEFNALLRPESLLSRKRIAETIAGFVPGLEIDDTVPTPAEVRLEVARNVDEALTVTAQPDTYLYSIRARTTDPEKSAELINNLAEIYIQDQVQVKFKATEFAVDWLAERVGELEIAVKESEDAIKALRSETELTSFEALEALSIRSKELRQRLEDTQQTAERLAARQQEADRHLGAREFVRFAAVFDDPQLNALLEGPNVGSARWETEFDARAQVLKTDLDAEVQRATAQVALFELSFKELSDELDEQNADLIELNQLTREAEANKVLYETFLTRLKETSVQIGLLQADSRVMSSAVTGERVSPRRSLILAVAVFAACLAASFTVLLRQYSHSGFRHADELELATGQPVIGQVPLLPVRKRSKILRYLQDNSTSAGVESIRNLRTSILLSNIDNPPQIIMSTSCTPGEGKTTQSIALAQNFSGLGHSVLLIEGDIRRQVMSQYFQKTVPGDMMGFFEDRYSLDDAIDKGVIAGVDVLMGGRSKANPADLFSSERFQNLLADVRGRYDHIIIDTPPLLAVPDARIIGRFVDTTIVSVRWNSTSKEQVTAGLRELRSVGVNIAGLVFSLVDHKGMKRYGGGYGAYSTYGNYG